MLTYLRWFFIDTSHLTHPKKDCETLTACKQTKLLFFSMLVVFFCFQKNVTGVKDRFQRKDKHIKSLFWSKGDKCSSLGICNQPNSWEGLTPSTGTLPKNWSIIHAVSDATRLIRFEISLSLAFAMYNLYWFFLRKLVFVICWLSSLYIRKRKI